MPSDHLPSQNLEPTNPVLDEMARFQKASYGPRANFYVRGKQESESIMAREKKADEYYLENLKRLLPPGGITYLDFGCGPGEHTAKFVAGLLPRNRVVNGYGITIAGEEVALATPTLPDFQVVEGGVEKIDFEENKFDLLTSFFYVLGHLSEADIEKFFQNVARSLKPGGVLCFDVLKSDSPLNQVIYSEYDTKLPDGSVIKCKIGEFPESVIIDLAKKNNLEIVDIARQSDSKGKHEEYMVVLRKKK